MPEIKIGVVSDAGRKLPAKGKPVFVEACASPNYENYLLIEHHVNPKKLMEIAVDGGRLEPLRLGLRTTLRPPRGQGSCGLTKKQGRAPVQGARL
jgi:hypothetical protein